MRIIIKGEGHHMRLRLPTGLLLNRFTATAICAEAEKHGVLIRRDQMQTIIKALHHYRRTHPDWVLVEASCADGDYVWVKL